MIALVGPLGGNHRHHGDCQHTGGDAEPPVQTRKAPGLEPRAAGKEISDELACGTRADSRHDQLRFRETGLQALDELTVNYDDLYDDCA